MVSAEVRPPSDESSRIVLASPRPLVVQRIGRATGGFCVLHGVEPVATDWGVIVQARLGSSRLPRKMLADVEPGTPLLAAVFRRILRAVEPCRVILATTVDEADAELSSIARETGIAVHRGSVDDVLSRFLEAAALMGWTRIIRVCADNPFLMPDALVPLVEELERKAVDYVGYRFTDGTWSVRSHCGLFTEAADCRALERCASDPLAGSAREHVTAHLYAAPHGYSTAALAVPREDIVRNWRLTVDTPADLDVVRTIYADVGFEGSLSIDQIAAAIDRHPDLMNTMQDTIEGQPK